MKAEIECLNDDCETVVPDAWGPGEHFRHRQLVALEARDIQGVVIHQKPERVPCPRCGGQVEGKRVVQDEQKFALGDVLISHGVLSLIAPEGEEDAEKLARNALELQRILRCHATGDWGDLDDEDKLSNERAIRDEELPLQRTRLLSVYTLVDEKVYVITEAGRHSTTVLFPNEY